MPGKRDLRRRVAMLFELPEDVMLDEARISMVGDMQLVVENHRGLIAYTPDQLVLAVPRGRLTVEGRDLQMGTISPDQVIVLGKLTAIRTEYD